MTNAACGFEFGVSRVSSNVLAGVGRCPHCAVANPLLFRIQTTASSGQPAAGGPGTAWGVFCCSTCGGWVTAKGGEGSANVGNALVEEIFPTPKTAHEDLPEVARRFLQQAYDTLHAPDAAAVMAGSAVDAMLKESGLKEGSLYDRINEAREKGLLTNAMADWAHEVRLGSNRPRHADADRPHVTEGEARQAVEFADALGNFLFVLTARIERGRKEAAKSSAAAKLSAAQ